MPRPYSEDLPLRVVNAVESGKTTREVATLFQVSSSFVANVHQRWQQTGHVHPKQIGGYRRAFLEPYEEGRIRGANSSTCSRPTKAQWHMKRSIASPCCMRLKPKVAR
ncbi:MAG: helix-turn-helix domain-containing protein [Methylobacter sp.]